MNSPMIKKLCGILDKASSFKAKKRTLIIIFILYIILLSTIAYFHEPWFDEAQAWQISRCASLSDILFKIPHYEGHPPLWHLILLPFAKTGMPYEFSLAFVNIVFSAAAVWIIMFKTKLPDLMRLTLPFTYFFFYQYGVVSRPYSLMAFALMLCAVFYREKSQKPVRMVLSLALLCLSSAYGLAIAAGICVVWLIEEWNGKNVFSFIKDFIKTKTFFCLLGLLVLAILIFIPIIPYKDAFGVNTSGRNKNIIGNLCYTLFVLPYDTTVGNYFCYDAEHLDFQFDMMFPLYLIISLLIVAIMYFFGKKHNCTRMIYIQFVYIPIIFAAALMFAHHIGISTMFLVFWLCICFDTEKPVLNLGKYDTALHYIFTVSACLFILVQISWTASSSVIDIKYNYASGREMAQYITENNLEDAKLMSSWHLSAGPNYSEENEEKYYNFNSSGAGTAILPYLDKNVFVNFNWGLDNMGYTEHRDILDIDEYEQTIKRFEELGVPDYFFGMITNANYALDNIHGHPFYIVHSVEYCMVFKNSYVKSYDVIYKFDDLENFLKEVTENEGTD